MPQDPKEFNKDWSPKSGETCAISDPENWKRDALLFDKIYVSHLDNIYNYGPDIPNDPNIPIDITFRYESYELNIGRKKIETDKWVYECVKGGASGALGSYEESHYGSNDPDEISVNLKRQLADACNKHGWDTTPIYNSIPLLYAEFSEGQKIAYDAAINNLPTINNERVSWAQIIEFRTDKNSVRKYRDLRLWLLHGLKAESVHHATDIIAKKIEDYIWAIKKHGMETKIGAFTQIFDWKKSSMMAAATGAATILGGPIAAALTSGLLITGNVGLWIAQRKLDLEGVKRAENREVAILFDAQKTFGEGNQ